MVNLALIVLVQLSDQTLQGLGFELLDVLYEAIDNQTKCLL